MGRVGWKYLDPRLGPHNCPIPIGGYHVPLVEFYEFSISRFWVFGCVKPYSAKEEKAAKQVGRKKKTDADDATTSKEVSKAQKEMNKDERDYTSKYKRTSTR